jgi:arginase
MTTSARRVSILEVPTSAGSHNPGQEKAPGRAACRGLADCLRGAEMTIEDRGDLPEARLRGR